MTLQSKILTRFLAIALLAAIAQSAKPVRNLNLDSFELVWTTLRDRYCDPTMAGLNWRAIHDRYLPQIRAAATQAQARPHDPPAPLLPPGHYPRLRLQQPARSQGSNR